MNAQAPADAARLPAIDACWNRIGVHGDSSCPELALHVHCRNCPVYSAAALKLLDRARVHDLAAVTRLFAADKVDEERGGHSAFLFRVGPEWLGIATGVLDEVADLRAIHSLPHRRSGVVLGLTNVRGELIVCASLSQLLGIEGSAEDGATRGRRTALRRLLVVRERGLRLAFPVDEVHGTQRYHESELKPAPSTVARATASYSRAVLPWDGHAVGLLDEELLFHSLNRNLE
ncbi:MAG: chemotaxis protein CheW [Arenimonas sp.]